MPDSITDTTLSYLLEHGLKADGMPDPEHQELSESGAFETFFTETNSGKYVPRSIFVDLDPSVGSACYEEDDTAFPDGLLANR